ncbi:MAG: acyl-CoA dehydrogenase [Sandaracinaceae bacterium]|nr:acyl-CoA dehydrogenase [Sandaracinaceae bacterium]
MTSGNPLLRDRFVDFLLHDVLDVVALTKLPAFSDHGRDTFDLYLGACRRLARERLSPTYRAMDEAPPRLEQGRVIVHPEVKRLFRELVDVGVITATRPTSVGGQQMPLTVAALAHAYLMAGNLSAYGYAGLTTGAAHLVEAFGSDALKATFMRPMYEGRWSGTMALTEPQAGSSLADVASTATPTPEGHYLVRGSKIFISGGDHDATENVVHLVLARIDGAPPGTKGISLFVVPRLRPTATGTLAPNDVNVSGVIHKIGWRGLPSLALSFGDANDCHGWLVGRPHEGLRCMFQMMNEARIMVGLNAASTASVAYLESLAYAQERAQGRAITEKDPTRPPAPIIEHADVRRMLLRQKAIVEGALCLLGTVSRYADLAEHASSEPERARCRALLDLLTPVAKSFPAERGFESNALALQIHGGYGYSSEYLPEAWLRDQKLNSIHEGTTGIQSLDLLGRKAIAGGGATLALFRDEVMASLSAARTAGVDERACEALATALDRMLALTATLGQRGMSGDVEGMLAHSADYLEAFSIVVIGWQWLTMWTAATRLPESAFARGLVRAARYWTVTELPRVAVLATLAESGERSYLDATPDEL